MQQLACSIAILAVTVIYLFWRSYLQALQRRQQRLSERVAFMLWMLADVDEASLVGVPAGALDNPLDMA